MATGKAPSTRNMENALGIGEEISKISGISSDEEKNKQFEDRQKKLKEIQNEFKQKHSSYQHDKDYIKEMYKELAETSMMAVRIMQEEAGMTGDYKNVEALAAAANAVSTALNGLKNVDIDEEKLRIERDKVDIRRSAVISTLTGSGSNGNGTTNVFFSSNVEFLKAIKDAEKSAFLTSSENLKNVEVIKSNDEIDKEEKDAN